MSSYQLPKLPIAIVGIAADLPSGTYSEDNLDYPKFVEFLLNKGEAYEEIPSDRFNITSWAGDAVGRVGTTRGSFLKGVDLFDNLEFGISPKETRAMALSTRKLIELAFLALLDSGIEYRGRNVACYSAGIAHDILSIAEPDELEARGSFAGAPSMIANKISYHLDLQGPSVPVDTACSSSLTALHLAVQALRAGECESAVVAGCQINMRLADFIQYSQASVLAPDGKCKPFDAKADGFSRGEGAVVVVLKLYEDALRDGDYIYGNILGTGINASGAAAPIYAPVAEAQVNAMRRAYEGTGRDPRDVDYVELHATGTAVGDPTEANWVGQHFSRETELLIGSVKGNIGHLEITAFLASLCKVCSIFETGQVPPNVNLLERNRAIKWEHYNLQVPLEPTQLEARSPSGQLLISMSSFGIGGANGHVVLESPSRPIDQANEQCAEGPVLFAAGGLSPRSSASVGDALCGLVETYQDQWSALSTIYGRRVRQMTWRTFAVARPAPQGTHMPLQFPPPVLSPRVKPPLVFVFGGQGPQHMNMGRQLFKRYPVFRNTILELDECYQRITGTSLIEQTGLFADVQPLQKLPSVWPMAITLPSLAMTQMALFDLICSFGLRPDVLIGHSAGETPMLYASGAGSKTMALEIAIARGCAMALVEDLGGTMAAVACDTSTAQSVIDIVLKAAHEDDVLEIACFNSPNAVTLTGHTRSIDAAVEVATSRGILARKIRTKLGGHSKLMEVCRSSYRTLVSGVFARHPGDHRPCINTFSTVTGELLDDFTEDYFWRNGRQPVDFSRGVESILRSYPDACFVELNPHPVLSTYVQEQGVPPSFIVSPMHRPKTEDEHHEGVMLLNALGQLSLMGCNSIDFGVLNSQPVVHSLHLPPYPFAKKRFPYLPEHSRVLRKQFGARNGPLNYADLRVNKFTHPEIAQHIINSEPIMPAAGFLEMVLEMGAKVIWNVQFHAMLSLSAEYPGPIDIDVNRMKWAIRSHPNGGDITTSGPRLHADGYMSRTAIDEKAGIDIAAIQHRCSTQSMSAFYEAIQYFAQYGPAFRRVTGFWLGLDEALVQIKGGDRGLPGYSNYIVHPAILDACIHVAVHPSFTTNPNRNVYYLPARLGAFALHERLTGGSTFPSTAYAHVVLKEWKPEEIIVDVSVVDSTGIRLCTLQGLAVEAHYNTLPRHVSKRYNLLYQPFGLRQRNPCAGDHLGIRSNANAACETVHMGKNARRPKTLTKSCANGMDFEGEHEKATRTGKLDHILRSVLTYVTQTCGKVAIRVLVLDDSSGFLHRHLCPLIEEITALHISVSYIIAAKDFDTQLLPPFGTHIPLDLSEPLHTQGLLEASFDIIFSFDVMEPLLPSDIRQLSNLLLPGAILVSAEYDEVPPTSVPGPSDELTLPLNEVPACETRLASLASLGFRTTEHMIEASNTNIFVVEAQRPSMSLPPSACSSMKQDILLLPYTVGAEIEIQRILKGVDLDQPVRIWFTALDGLDADGGRGFTRSLRREFPLWDIGLVIFTFQCPPVEQLPLVHYISAIPGMEREIIIDEDYEVSVPRFYECPSTASNSSTSRGYSHGPRLGDLSPTDVEMTVVAMSTSEAGLFGIVGRVTKVGCRLDSPLLGALVATVVKDATPATFQVHRGCVFPLTGAVDPRIVASILPSLLIGGLALGAGVLEMPPRALLERIIVTHSDSRIGQILLWFFGILRLHSVGLPSKASPLDLLSLDMRPRDLVISSYDEDNQLLDGFITNGTRIFPWKSSDRLAHTIAGDPWLIGSILQASMAHIPSVDLPAFLPGGEVEAVPANVVHELFKSDAAYLLVGGVGSLGLHIAVWMYEKGARHIVLTSRSGQDSLHRANDTLALRMLKFLQTRPDTSVSVEASDASSPDAFKKLLARISRPIAGCMLLSGVLSDHSFFSQDLNSFDNVFGPKLRAFESLEAGLKIESLDFLITFSSIATFGNAGQTNYSSANTVIEGKTARYKNAFSIVAPAISDTVSVVGRPDQNYQTPRFQHLIPWSYSARELCHCLEDGILRLMDESFKLYVPDLDWTLVKKHLGPSPLYDHLVRETSATSSGMAPGDSRDVLCDIVLQSLDIAPDDFSPEIPLTSYGMDSLSAGRLSFALRPYLVISQMQLLSDISLLDIERRLEEAKDLAQPFPPAGVLHQWDPVNDAGQTLVKLADYGGTPLILIHGGSGSLAPFIPMQQIFKTSLWALQTTPDTPMHSIDAIAQFYYEHIKAAQPEGPYRMGSFSGTSVILLRIAQLFESDGDTVAQLCFLDHFPLLFVNPPINLDEESIRTRSLGPALLQGSIDIIIDMYIADGSPVCHRVAQAFKDATSGLEVPEQVRGWLSTLKKLLTITYEFLFNLLPPDQPLTAVALSDAIKKWMRSVHTPLTIYLAKKGFASIMPPETEGESVAAQLVTLEGSHFSFMETRELAELLQDGWVDSGAAPVPLATAHNTTSSLDYHGF
ncbi:ketoacyl-synt-domain-containing protein [Leucogyrophana mollusca]|uniref:Ketoacyl-synt-domain-containing protein n=1 Tax=Leucogyrophana mollusca TaxID=85980 RepID=A0ACB8BVW0_9AGAM|nr:ketoacyl-synt-domain-containing protein [Leucogyrophana mollusca]